MHSKKKENVKAWAEPLIKNGTGAYGCFRET